MTHIDDSTIHNLTGFYRDQIGAESARPHVVVDLSSSRRDPLRACLWTGDERCGTKANPRLSDYCVQDLNESPTLPYASETFDAVLIAVSIQYLTRPIEVMTEINRCLAEGGQCIVAMSHRLFPTKAIQAFHVLSPNDRCRSLRIHGESGMTDIEALDYLQLGRPLWIVRGYRV